MAAFSQAELEVPWIFRALSLMPALRAVSAINAPLGTTEAGINSPESTRAISVTALRFRTLQVKASGENRDERCLDGA